MPWGNANALGKRQLPWGNANCPGPNNDKFLFISPIKMPELFYGFDRI
jgi:hypothetical protein